MPKQTVILRFCGIGFGVVLGLSILMYHGPMVEILRGNIGDGVAVFVLALSIGFWTRRAWMGAVTGLSIAVILEIGQVYLRSGDSPRDIVLGAVFDWWDFVAYVIGSMSAWVFERRLRKEK